MTKLFGGNFDYLPYIKYVKYKRVVKMEVFAIARFNNHQQSMSKTLVVLLGDIALTLIQIFIQSLKFDLSQFLF